MVNSIHPQVAYQMIKAGGVVVIDIRPQSFSKSATIVDAILMTSQQLIDHQQQFQRQHEQVLILCQNGEQSSDLSDLLGAGFLSIEGGYELWSALQLPVESPKIDLLNDRYRHQINLSGFGEAAQQSLADAHVAVVGAGGLGAPALMYLTAAGIGNITLIDDDLVVLSNLHRQILYNETDLGLSKVQQARIKLKNINSASNIHSHQLRVDKSNISMLLQGADVVLDGTDNFSSRYLINDYCLANDIPWVFAAVSGFELQVGMFGLSHQDSCFRCMFPNLSDQANSCIDDGVLGPVAGIAAMLQVTEALKFLAKLGANLQQQIIHYNVMTHRFKVLKYPPQNKCPHR